MKLYQKLTPERQTDIDSRVAELNSLYSVNGIFDYDLLCREMDIRYYEHPNIVCPTTIPRMEKGEDGYLLRDQEGRIILSPKLDIGNFPFKIGFVREHTKAHEFAHVILGHNRNTPGLETEANYFAGQLTGIKCPPILITLIGAVEIMIRNKVMVDHYETNDSPSHRLYHRDLRELIETIPPIHPSNLSGMSPLNQ